jgi:hypothetical protein
MNPGPTEEAGNTARTLITSLASTPVVLALVVFNCIYLASGVYSSIQQGQRFTENQKIWAAMVEKAMAYSPDQRDKH